MRNFLINAAFIFWLILCLGSLFTTAHGIGNLECSLQHRNAPTQWSIFDGCKILYRGYWYSPEELQRKLDKQAEVQS